jgi:hypothetical protein
MTNSPSLSKEALISLILGIIAIFCSTFLLCGLFIIQCIISISAIVFGVLASTRIKQDRQKGKSLAIIGIIISILAMIFSLSLTSVTECAHLLPPRCAFSQEIECLRFNIYDSESVGHVDFVFKNAIGSAASFNFSITYFGDYRDNGYPSARCDNIMNLPSGQAEEIRCVFDGVSPNDLVILPVGDKAKFGVNMTYRKLDETRWNPASGVIYGPVQQE